MKCDSFRAQMQGQKPMRLLVKQGETVVNEFQFGKGPIYIGRHTKSQIFLSHRAVSRQHAVIFETQDGQWMVEDLDSANKTYLNDEAIHKAEIKTGDSIRIVGFTIEVNLKKDKNADKAIDMEDTLSKTAYNLEATQATGAYDIIVRKPDAEHAPAMRLPAKRLTDFSQAAEAICEAGDADELLLTLLDITLEQFSAYHTWCALREEPTGPMTSHAGKGEDGRAVELSDIRLNKKITEAVEKGECLVLPRVSAQMEEEQIRSAMIAPIMRSAGCFGVLYVDNSMDHEHYSLGDLDYLMLVGIHTGAVLEKLLNL
jgi:predicted component of type VI protein secretion system